jgi:hypothetical protein
MPRTVQDIMNRELLAIRPDLPVKGGTEPLRHFKVGAAPVLDEGKRPVPSAWCPSAICSMATTWSQLAGQDEVGQPVAESRPMRTT